MSQTSRTRNGEPESVVADSPGTGVEDFTAASASGAPDSAPEQSAGGVDPDSVAKAYASSEQDTGTNDGGEATGASTELSLEEQLEAARAEASENYDQFLRARAELDNVRKRMDRDIENARRYGLEKFLNDLLPVKDSLELGVAAASQSEASVEALLEGSELTLKMLSSLVEKFGATEIEAENQPFDPQLHEAMTMQPCDGVEPGTVVAVIQKGYRLSDRLLRPARVIVSK